MFHLRLKEIVGDGGVGEVGVDADFLTHGHHYLTLEVVGHQMGPPAASSGWMRVRMAARRTGSAGT